MVFSGADGPTLDLEENNDPVGRLAGIAWQYVRTLYEYARLKHDGAFSGSVFKYLQGGQDDDGYRYGPGGYAPVESETVRNTPPMRQERVFSVPSEVDASGTCFMEEHFRLETRDSTAPRMYFLDATASTGMIYIGYIGKHLTNTRSH